MKINLPQLAASCEQQFAPLYLVSGNELILVREAKQTLLHYAKHHGFTHRITYTLTAPFAWDPIQQALTHYSLFEENPLVIVHIDQLKIDKAGSALLQKVASGHYTHARMLLITPKCDAACQRTAWFQAISKQSVFVPVWPLKPQQWHAWFQQRCQRAGLNLDQHALQLSLDYLKGDLLASTQLVEQLRLAFGHDVISTTQIKPWLYQQTHEDLFQLCDQVLSAEAFHRTLKTLQHTGIEATLVLWALTRDLRTLIHLSEQQAQGLTLNEAFKKAGVWVQRQTRMTQALKRHPIHTWQHLLRWAMHIDQSLKGIIPGQPWDELMQLCFAMSGQAVLQHVH